MGELFKYGSNDSAETIGLSVKTNNLTASRTFIQVKAESRKPFVEWAYFLQQIFHDLSFLCFIYHIFEERKLLDLFCRRCPLPM